MISEAKFPFQDKDITGKGKLLFGAANTIYKYILQQFPSFEDELAPFAGYVLNRVRFVQIETHDMSDALKIFETINQRGIGLTPMDLLKNMILLASGVPSHILSGITDHFLSENWEPINEFLDCQQPRLANCLFLCCHRLNSLNLASLH